MDNTLGISILAAGGLGNASIQVGHENRLFDPIHHGGDNYRWGIKISRFSTNK